MAEPIAPPNVQDDSEVAVPAVSNALPSGLAAINNAVSTGGQDPKANIAASKAITEKMAMDESGHINTQAQWGSVVANLLMRNYTGALNAFNGGETREYEGRTANGQKFYKQYNARGYTGKMYGMDGVALSPEEQKNVEEKMGGVVTDRDKTALNTGLYQGLKASEISNITGLSLQATSSAVNAYQTSQAASRMNQGLTELEVLTKKLGDKLNLVKNAPADVREGIFRFKTGQQATAGGKTTGTSKSEGGSATTQDTGTVSVGIGTKIFGGKGSSTELNQGTSSTGKSQETGTTSSSSAAGQETTESKILGYFQKHLKGEDVGDMMRWVQLSQLVNESQYNLEQSKERAPGVVSVAPTELGLTDRSTAFQNTINMKRNNALEAAWSSFMADSMLKGRQNLGSEKLREEFMNTNTFKGINNMYDHELKTDKDNKEPEITEGTIHVDNRNRPTIWKNGRWEPMNVR